MLVRSVSGPGGDVRVEPDRRSSYRFDLRSEGSALVCADLRWPLVDIGAGGARVRCVEAADRTVLGHCLLVLESGRELTCSAVPVRRTRAADGSPCLGVRFAGLSHDSRYALSEYLVGKQGEQRRARARLFQPADGIVESSAERFVRLLRLYALRRCETLRIYQGETRLECRLAVRAVGPDGVRGMEVGRGLEVLRTGQTYGFVACGEGSVVAFETTVERGSDGEVRLPVPSCFVQSGFRSSPRGAAAEGERPWAWLTHAALDGRSRAVDEVSAQGFSVRIDLGSEPIWPGATLAAVHLALGGRTVRARGKVRSVTPSANGRSARCGIELTEFASGSEERRWRKAVFAWLHPSLVAGAHATPDTAWDVLESSAYVSEWADGDEQRRARKAYVEAWGSRRGRAGRLLLLRGPAGVAATAAGTWLYPRTWMFHHFGVDQRLRLGQRSFLSYSKELYTGALYEYRHMAGLEYFTLFVERGKRWNDVMYGDFCARHPDRTKLLYRPNEVFRCDTHAAVSTDDVVSTGQVREAEAPDLALLSAHLDEAHSPLELDAMAWRRRDLEPGVLRDRFASVGFERDRRVFVQDAGHGPTWAAVCESGDEGVNVFGLLNTCRLHCLVPSTDLAARAALLARVIQHYRQLGKRHVVLFEPAGAESLDAQAAGFRHLSGGMHWLAHRDVMPAWLTHVRDALSVASGRVRERRVA